MGEQATRELTDAGKRIAKRLREWADDPGRSDPGYQPHAPKTVTALDVVEQIRTGRVTAERQGNQYKVGVDVFGGRHYWDYESRHIAACKFAMAVRIAASVKWLRGLADEIGGHADRLERAMAEALCRESLQEAEARAASPASPSVGDAP